MSTDGKDVVAAKRNSLLSDDDKFYNFQKVVRFLFLSLLV